MHCIHCVQPIFNGEGIRLSSAMSIRLSIHPDCLSRLYREMFNGNGSKYRVKVWRRHARRSEAYALLRSSEYTARCARYHHRECRGKTSYGNLCACPHHLKLASVVELPKAR